MLSNKEARKLAAGILEATVPPGSNPTGFTVRILVGEDGAVRGVFNAYDISAPLFNAAADAVRHWRFRSDLLDAKPHSFQADITFHGPIAGTVSKGDGTPIDGAIVYGSEWKTCCPYQQDTVTTDKTGSFRIEHPGSVLHFLAGDDFQPQSLIVTPEMSTVKMTLEPSSNSLQMPVCDEPQKGIERLGRGKYGLQFDVPKHDARVFHGKTNTDYMVQVVKAKRSDDRVEFWFGPYAMNSTPGDEQFTDSEMFAARHVIVSQGVFAPDKGGVVGMDTWGRAPDGTLWRHMAVPGDGAVYQGVKPENAALFDKIINSLCWAPYPNR